MSDDKPDFEGFAKAVVSSHPEWSLDGFDLQDLAIKYGLLKEELRPVPCSFGSCNCLQYGAEMGGVSKCLVPNYEVDQ